MFWTDHIGINVIPSAGFILEYRFELAEQERMAWPAWTLLSRLLKVAANTQTPFRLQPYLAVWQKVETFYDLYTTD